MITEVHALQVNYPEPDHSEPEKRRGPVEINPKTVALAVLVIIAGLVTASGMIGS